MAFPLPRLRRCREPGPLADGFQSPGTAIKSPLTVLGFRLQLRCVFTLLTTLVQFCKIGRRRIGQAHAPDHRAQIFQLEGLLELRFEMLSRKWYAVGVNALPVMNTIRAT
jgi:hypothetical protein